MTLTRPPFGLWRANLATLPGNDGIQLHSLHVCSALPSPRIRASLRKILGNNLTPRCSLSRLILFVRRPLLPGICHNKENTNREPTSAIAPMQHDTSSWLLTSRSLSGGSHVATVQESRGSLTIEVMSDTKTLHKTSAQDLASWMGFGAAAAWEHRPPAISHSDELTCPASRSPQAQVCNMQQEPRIPPSPEHIPSGGSPAFGFLKLGCAIQRPKLSQADSQGLDVLDESTFEPSMSSLKSGSSFSAVSSSHAKLSRSSLPQR